MAADPDEVYERAVRLDNMVADSGHEWSSYMRWLGNQGGQSRQGERQGMQWEKAVVEWCWGCGFK